jgi:hypothetical protein
MVVVMKSAVVQDVTLCSPLKVNQRFGEHVSSIFRVEEQAKQETSMEAVGKHSRAYSLTLKMEVTCSSETSVDFEWTWHYIPEDRTLDLYIVILDCLTEKCFMIFTHYMSFISVNINV